MSQSEAGQRRLQPGVPQKRPDITTANYLNYLNINLDITHNVWYIGSNDRGTL